MHSQQDEWQGKGWQQVPSFIRCETLFALSHDEIQGLMTRANVIL